MSECSLLMLAGTKALSLSLSLFFFWICDRSGHIQNGIPARHKKSGKMEKMEMAPAPKWPKNGRRNGKMAILAIFRPCWAWGHFPFSFPFSRDSCVGQVSHSVYGYFDRNFGWSPKMPPNVLQIGHPRSAAIQYAEDTSPIKTVHMA